MRWGIAVFAVLLAFAGPARAGPPVILELYTSQGCGACADASGVVADLAEAEDVLPLIFSVDYWDYLGWRDTFARPEFSARQKSYADRWDAPAVFTPQVVVDGVGQARATESGAVERLIRKAKGAQRAAPDVEIQKTRVLVGSGERLAAPADVWLIRYDPRGRQVDVTRGENQGRTLGYRNVVRELVRLGGWHGKPAAFALPPSREVGLETLVVVQQPDGGEVLALADRASAAQATLTMPRTTWTGQGSRRSP
jgi:hypothetical protein